MKYRILYTLALMLAPLSPAFAEGESAMSTPADTAEPAHTTATQPHAGAHQFTFSGVEGPPINMADYAGKVVLVVNTASRCGFTPQYAGLQALHEQYKDKGLVVLGVPSADFGGQEFDTEAEVKEFTDTKFEITFPLTSISTVSGGDAHPFYQWANKKAGFLGSPKWNFHKYLIGKDGQFVAWFSSVTAPDADKVTKAIDQALAAQ